MSSFWGPPQARAVREKSVKITVSTDAYSVETLDYMRLGIGQACRGWLEAADVLNTRSWDELKELLRKK